MTATKDTLVAWLRDAHAMEKATIDIMERQISDLEDYPQLTARTRQHLEETHRQEQRVEQCLQQLGADTSTVKDAATRFMGMTQVMAVGAAPDEAVKNCLAGQAIENFEIASYVSLSAAAEAAGEPEIKRLCDETLQEERAMASWLEQHIPEVTQQYLRR